MENQTPKHGEPKRNFIEIDTFKAALRAACVVTLSALLGTDTADVNNLSRTTPHAQTAATREVEQNQIPTMKDVTIVPRRATYNQLFAASFTNDTRTMEYAVNAVPQSDEFGYGAGYFVNGFTKSSHWYQVALVYNWPGHLNGKNYYFKGFNMLFNVFHFDQNGNEQKFVGIRKFDGEVRPGDRIELKLYFSGGRIIMSAYDSNTHAQARISFKSSDHIFIGTEDYVSANGPFTGLMTERHSPTPAFNSLNPVTYHQISGTSSPVHLFEMELNPDQNELYQTVSRVIRTQSEDYNYDVQRGNETYLLQYKPNGDFTTGSLNHPIQN